MSIAFYFIVVCLPLFLLARSEPPWGFGWMDRGRLSDGQLAVIYAIPLVFVWSCVFGLLPAIDTVLFSRSPQHWCVRAFGESSLAMCRYFSFFAWDDLTVLFLSAAIPVWATRRLGRLARLGSWLVVALAVFVLLEEIRYLPMSYLFGRGGVPDSLHAQLWVVNALFGMGLLAVLGLAVLIYLARGVLRCGSWRHSSPARILEQVPLPRGVHVLGALLLPQLTCIIIALSFSFENDKYHDFGQSMAYLGLLLVGLDLPGEVFSTDRPPSLTRKLAGVGMVVIAVAVVARMMLGGVDG